MSDAEREVLKPRGVKMTRQLRAQFDVEKLWPQPEFKRFTFTLLESAGIYTGAYGTDGRHLQVAEGRRSLGFDILRTVEKIDPAAHALILAEETKTQQETPRARSQYDRLSELDDGPRGSEPGKRPGDGLVEFLDYSVDAG